MSSATVETIHEHNGENDGNGYTGKDGGQEAFAENVGAGIPTHWPIADAPVAGRRKLQTERLSGCPLWQNGPRTIHKQRMEIKHEN